MDGSNWLQGPRKDVFMGKPFSSGSDPTAVSDLIARSAEHTPAASQEFPLDLMNEPNSLGDLLNWGRSDILGDLESTLESPPSSQQQQMKMTEPKLTNKVCQHTEEVSMEEVPGDEQIIYTLAVEDEKSKIFHFAFLPNKPSPLATTTAVSVASNVNELIQTALAATSPMLIKTEPPKPLKRLAPAGSGILPNRKQSATSAGRKKSAWKNVDKTSDAYLNHREKNNASVKKSRAKANARVQQLAGDYEYLVSQNAALEEENFVLKTENSALVKECDELREECAGLKSERANLKQRSAGFEEKCAILQQKCVGLQTKLESANRERCPNRMKHFADDDDIASPYNPYLC